MGLTRVAISRPLFILMVITAMVILGAVSYSRLNVELFPSINVPVVTVITAYPGAAPDDVERLVTKPIEDAVSGISNVDVLSSSSTEGQSSVTITFTDRANADIAATDVEEICNELFTEQYVAFAYKDPQDCLEDPKTDDVLEIEVGEITGIDGVRATVEVEITDGDPKLEGEPLEDTLFYVDGRWRLYTSAVSSG